jgi:superfamily II DNA or RNA helicase
MKLRPYQEDALTALSADWACGYRRIGVSAATGTGKTVIMSHLAHRHVAHGRVLILVHRDELVRQTVDKLNRVDASVSIGVVKAGENSAGARIVVASVQTACRPRRLAQLGRFGLIICDEAHRSVADQWQTVLRGLGAFEDNGPVTAGFSATWSRADNRGLDEVWEKISFELSTEWAIEQGFLVRPVGKYIRTDIRLKDMKQTAGDYNAADLEKKLSRESVRDAIVAGYLEHARDRSGVVFAPTVDTGEFFREGFAAAGIVSEGLYGITSRDDSRLIHKRHRQGDTQLLISCTRLSEGWDAPWCSAGVIARPTTHAGLFVQMVGRVLRPFCGIHPGGCDCPYRKRDALILDPTGVLFKHTLNGLIDLSSSAREETDDDPEELTEDFESEGQDPADFVDADVSGYEDVDLLGAPYLRTEGGIRFSHETATRVRFIIGPLQHLYPWYSVGWYDTQSGQGGWHATQLTDEASALRALPDRRGIPSPLLRGRRATVRQRRAAESQGVHPRRGELAGDLFDRVQARLASRALDTQSWS